MICIYHSRDLDGWMSAAIVKLKYPDVKLIGWDYGQPIPSIVDAEIIIMVDISFPKDIMNQYDGTKLIWIDHHISAIKENLNLRANGIRGDKFAACELTWQFFFPDKPMPEIVRLLGRYDCFGHKGTDEELKVLQFQYGARQRISNPDDAFKYLSLYMQEEIPSLRNPVIEEIHEAGVSIYRYLCTEARQTYAKRYPVMFDTYKFAMVNQERFNPINFGIDYHKDGYDGFACCWYQKGKWMYSLYNDNGLIDCSEICKSRGGGGHRGASGFSSDVFLTE
jgi:hypothetical protein